MPLKITSIPSPGTWTRKGSKMSDYTVIPKPGSDRFVIADSNGKVVDDAQGYGYISKNSAEKAKWYKFGGGEQKINTAKNEAKKFWREHKDVAKYLNELYEYNIKEVALGEYNDEDFIKAACEKYHIDKFPAKYLKYLPD